MILIDTLHFRDGVADCGVLENAAGQVQRGRDVGDGRLSQHGLTGAVERLNEALNAARIAGTSDDQIREIEPLQAEIVERSFREFLAGVAPKAMVRRPNQEGIADHSAKERG